MSTEDKKTAEIPPIEPAQPGAPVPRSGAGAGSALFAMLKKRQMRASGDNESDPQSTGAGSRNTGD